MSGSDNHSGEIDSEDLMMEPDYSHRRCCFFGPPGFDCWQRMRRAGAGGGGADEGWAERGWKKLREWSELVAGPRWKTFIRRFGRSRVAGGGNNGGQGGQGRFGYDPLSYALNFDDGQIGQSDEAESGFRDFSSRYAAVPSSAKSSMDLGRDGPSFT